MRLRNIPGAREEMLVNPFIVQEPARLRGRWHEEFGNDRPIRIEIGMGKGQFLLTLAQRNPGINYIGIEKYSSVLLRALTKQEELKLPNLRLIRYDAETIDEVFGDGEVDRIYLNFSDPWPKDRHAKRRLTSDRFLARYAKILAAAGCVEFKTDNVDLFDFSLEEAAANGWTLSYVTRDLHSEPEAETNVTTEYEDRFSAKGNPICKMIITRDQPREQ
ncbi:MAG: tRNA (guanosine(46)-N7)-methyltransferase TrmB [Lachnospiraceae bacterium]|nr:tRNA (guanosine(46)-N7)-methyltransferase TrmB [Lachnospiraceae bacterium]